jgi:exopolyphosphatase/guanosine-5'-triphosphate,3'-diphosphate pyrophosphatase
LAIIDIGSNSLRLMVVHRLGENLAAIIDEQKATPRLALAKDSDGYLTLDGFSRLVQALQYFRDIAHAYHADPIIVRATASLRNLSNQQQVLQEITRQTGLPVTVLSGEEEAQIGFRAVQATMGLTRGWTVDVGGGSTEIVTFNDGQLVHQQSFPFGAVSLTTRFPIYRDLQSWISQQFATVNWLPRMSGQGIALGGSARVMARALQEELDYPLRQIHHFTVPTLMVETWLSNVAAMTPEQRRKVAHIPKDRIDIIVPGVAIILGLLKATQTEELTISGYGLRNGLLLDYLATDHAPEFSSIPLQSALTVAMRSEWPLSLALQLQQQVAELGAALQPVLGWSPRNIELARTAALLRYAGRNINMYHWDQHTFYHILAAPLAGLNHNEWLQVALIASFKSAKRLQKLWSPYSSIIARQDLIAVHQLGVLVRLAELFSPPLMTGVERLNIHHENKQLTITVSGTGISGPSKDLEDLAKDIKKSWQVKLIVPGLTT